MEVLVELSVATVVVVGSVLLVVLAPVDVVDPVVEDVDSVLLVEEDVEVELDVDIEVDEVVSGIVVESVVTSVDAASVVEAVVVATVVVVVRSPCQIQKQSRMPVVESSKLAGALSPG